MRWLFHEIRCIPRSGRALLGQGLVGLGHLLEDALMLLGHDGPDDQQGSDHQRRRDDEADDHVLDQAGQDEADEGNAGHGQRIGDLGEHMVQVVAVSTSGSHDGGIGDGGAVVAHNAAGAGSSQTDGAQDGLGVEVKT